MRKLRVFKKRHFIAEFQKIAEQRVVGHFDRDQFTGSSVLSVVISLAIKAQVK